MVLGKTFVDLHVGISPWREQWTRKHCRNERYKGVWDAKLQREHLRLPDGRVLSFFLDGPATRNDLPYIFVFHAMFLSGNSFIMACEPQDYILVCVNRPGYFGSDHPVASPNSLYTHESFATDIEYLADHLQVETFYVAGHSSGGPCALACAAHLPHRVLGVGLLSGDPEYAHPTAPNKKWVSRVCIGSVLPAMLEYCCCCLPLARLASPGLRNDYRMDTSPYSFEIEHHVKQSTLIYVGEHDQILPVSMSRHTQQRLLAAHKTHLEVVPDIGHLGLLRDEVLEDFFHELIEMTSTAIRDDSLALDEAVLEIPPASLEDTTPKHRRTID